VRTNYVLVDYESVQPSSIAVLEQECFKVMIFVGEKQAKIGFEMAASLQRLGPKAEYVKMSGSGPNALDFHIAFYMGQLSIAEPKAFFHIVSKDTGFDPLIAHMKSRKILAARSTRVEDISMVKVVSAKTPSERLATIIANLRQRGAAKPRTTKTLTSTIHAIFLKSLPDTEVASLLDQLQQQGFISISGAKVVYALPGDEG
jgi:hypothetical protein